MISFYLFGEYCLVRIQRILDTYTQDTQMYPNLVFTSLTEKAWLVIKTLIQNQLPLLQCDNQWSMRSCMFCPFVHFFMDSQKVGTSAKEKLALCLRPLPAIRVRSLCTTSLKFSARRISPGCADSEAGCEVREQTLTTTLPSFF